VAVQGLQTACEVLGRQVVSEVRSQLIVGFVVEPFDRRVLDRPIHQLDLAVRRGMARFGQSVFDPVRLADHVEAHRPGIVGVPVPGLLRELSAVISQNGVDVIGHRLKHLLQELPCRFSVSRRNELSDRELGRPVDADEQVELALRRLHFRDVDMKEPDGVTLELLPLGLDTLDIRKT
jgi:hypothetical protein